MWHIMNKERKPLRWISSAREDLRDFPSQVRRIMGFALDQAQRSGKHPDAKPLKGFGSAGILEVIDDYDGDTYRAVYTVRFAGIVYMLHAFQKKSKKGIATPKHEIDLIKRRLKEAEKDYLEWKATQKRSIDE